MVGEAAEGHGMTAVGGTHATAVHGSGDGHSAPPKESGVTAHGAASPGDPHWMRPTGVVNQYELIRELGRGGMGTVWLARDQRLGRKVAIKFLSLPDPAYRDRFLVEARATAQCQHPNIVVIHEVNEADGLPFMVLEFLEGQPLSGVIEGRLVTAHQAVELMVPVVQALVRAGEERLVHRDLKPDNIFLTKLGTVKVLDFGIAKIFLEGREGDAPKTFSIESLKEIYRTLSTGGLVGTLPYMSPEQWGLAPVDHRTDIWAIGVILFEMVTGRHPVEPLTAATLTKMIGGSAPLPSVRALRPDLSDGLVQVIDCCLMRDPEARYHDAAALLEALQSLAPGRSALSLTEGASPYPGMVPFQEKDAYRFFGRRADVNRAVVALEHQPLLAVVGPSGTGKSSFVRAGLLSALSARGEDWESLVVRPGKRPFDSLASLLLPYLTLTRATQSHDDLVKEHDELAARLKAEPGFLGTALRARARQRGAKYLLFVDQFEELYTLVDDEETRRAFSQCLSAVADDASAPLRVVLSMRSDLLDRVSEDKQFQGQVARGLLFLAAPGPAELREALVEPAGLCGYSFEEEGILSDMIGALAGSAGALPLLQFAAAKLWDDRDTQRTLLTRESYDRMGGVGGALARHADDVVSQLSPEMRGLTRQLFQRLVTRERTREILELKDVEGLHRDPAEMRSLVSLLATARLLIVQTSETEGSEHATLEVVHESLIENWPTLRRWLDESADDSEFVRQLSAISKQWEVRGRDRGLLWRGDALEEAIRFKKRFRGTLAQREADYLEASVQLSERAARIRRFLVIGTIVVLGGLVFAASIALVRIQAAEKEARSQAAAAMSANQQIEADSKKIAAQLSALEEAERQQEVAKKALKTTEFNADSTKNQMLDAIQLLRDEESELKRKLSSSEKEVKALTTTDSFKRLATLAVETEEQKAQLTKLKAELAGVQASLTAVTSEKNRLQAKVDAAKPKVAGGLAQ